MKKNQPQVAITMGSDSDLPCMESAAKALAYFQIPFEMRILSAHRTPGHVIRFAQVARKRGISVVIAGAGGAAHLPGLIASHTELPVIGVPVPIGTLGGGDALLSIVQMSQGVPVATVGIGDAWNAGILAAQILGAGTSKKILDQLKEYKASLENT